jgi:hypothetical protein
MLLKDLPGETFLWRILESGVSVMTYGRKVSSLREVSRSYLKTAPYHSGLLISPDPLANHSVSLMPCVARDEGTRAG